MDDTAVERSVEEVIAEQHLALASLQQTREDMRNDFPALGAALWNLAHDPLTPKHNREEWIQWVAKLSVYMTSFDEAFTTLEMLITNNLGLIELHQSQVIDLDS
jgi:hypothetical protein